VAVILVALSAEFSLGFRYGLIVYAGVAALHQAVGRELPVFVAVTAEPLASGVVPLVFEAHSDAIASEGPELLPEPVVEIALPFAGENLDDLAAAAREFGAVAPLGVRSVGDGQKAALINFSYLANAVMPPETKPSKR